MQDNSLMCTGIRLKAKNNDIIYARTLALCNRLDIDVSEIVCAKIEEIKKKYPVDKCRGKKDKYTEL